jgi:hypothetical protein
MLAGAAVAVTFFFFKVPANWAGFGAFTAAALGMIIGSLLGKPSARSAQSA